MFLANLKIFKDSKWPKTARPVNKAEQELEKAKESLTVLLPSGNHRGAVQVLITLRAICADCLNY